MNVQSMPNNELLLFNNQAHSFQACRRNKGLTETPLSYLFYTPVFIFIYLFIFNKFILFIYFWLGWVFVAVHGLSLVAASRGYTWLRCAGFSLQWLLLLRGTGSRHVGFSSCGMCTQ